MNIDIKSDQRLFGFCEFYLADNEIITPNIILSQQDILINSFLRFGGLPSLIFLYIFLVLRRTNIYLPVYKNIAILDIKSGYILRKSEIAKERENIVLQRFHFPRIKIIKELINSYLRYKNIISKNDFTQSTDPDYNKITKENCTEIYMISKCASQNRLYLLWLLNFYLHRSVCLANSDLILSKIQKVITIDEYVPQIAGYISAFIDIGLPLNLYLPKKITKQRLTLYSLSIFNKVILANGEDADLIRSSYNGLMYLEKIVNHSMKLNLQVPPRVGIFLSSYYNLCVADLIDHISLFLVPFIHSIQIAWKADSVIVHCHPNDLTPEKILKEHNTSCCNEVVDQDLRMNNYDLVVVGNSSVTEEALRRGVPVVYLGSIDKWKYDLYGYVKCGIVIDATQSLPTLDEISEFYENSITKKILFEFNNGTKAHIKYDFIDIICL
ncbi:MAG: hypothetical protein WCI64_08235 [Chlorobium sp.]